MSPLSPPSRILFMGSGDIALPTFQSLNPQSLIGLITQPDRPVGRHQRLQLSKIKEDALHRSIPVWQPPSIRSKDFLEEMKSLAPEWIVVMAYGQILPPDFIELASQKTINLHASLLPKYRGASCIQQAIANRDQKSGITIIEVVKALDAGPILHQEELLLAANETGESLHDRLALLAPQTLQHFFSLWNTNQCHPKSQKEEESSYAPKLERQDGKINWNLSAEVLSAQIAAYSPWPGSFMQTQWNSKQLRIKVFHPVKPLDKSGIPGHILESSNRLVIACGKGSLELFSLQADGKKKMPVADFLRGIPLKIGAFMGTSP